MSIASLAGALIATQLDNRMAILYVVLPPFCFYFITYRCFEQDMHRNWNINTGIMPLSAHNIVLTRYITIVIVILMGVIGSCISNVIITREITNTTMQPFLLIQVSIALALLSASVFLPCVYFFKGKNMEIVLILSTLIPVELCSIGVNLLRQFIDLKQAMSFQNMVMGILIIAIICFMISYGICCVAYRKTWRKRL